MLQSTWLMVALCALSGVAAAADHLVISEVAVKERNNVPSAGSEFIEILNPTAGSIDLSDVYLTDAIFTGVGYWQIVLGDGQGGSGTGSFHARFPDGMSLGAGEFLVVSLMGSTKFQASYGYLPDLELYEDGAAPDAVPEMREAFPQSIAAGLGSNYTNAPLNDGWLADTGESLTLYTWDGASDLVADLDYVVWGTGNSYRVSKTSVSIDGPDADEVASAYADDTALGAQDALGVPATGKSLLRTNIDEAGETLTGGNGLNGHDETSEPFTTTWSSDADQDPTSTVEVPGPAPIFMGVSLSPETPETDEPASVTADLETYGTIGTVTLWYSADGGDWIDRVMNEDAVKSFSAEIPGLAEGTVVKWYVSADARFGEVTYPANAPFYSSTFTVIPPPPPPPTPAHLLLTEVCAGSTEFEFIEIFNPTDEVVALDYYFLTEAIFNVADQFYWQITDGNPTRDSIGGGAYDDFHARFPLGTVIGPGDVLVVSMADNTSFESVYGYSPDLELYESGDGTDDVPEMLPVFAGSIAGPESSEGLLEDHWGEPIILYFWDEVSPLVVDIDMFRYGAAVDADDWTLFQKTTTQGYLDDASLQTQADNVVDEDHSDGSSYQRIDLNEGEELRPDGTYPGGNGVDGHDETSEAYNVTWGIDLANPGEYVVPVYSTELRLDVPAKTFLPDLETLPITFSTLAGHETTLRILDLEGRVVKHLWDTRFDDIGADRTMTWNGRNDTFELVKAGTYVVHLKTVNEETGEITETTAPAVVATRLSR